MNPVKSISINHPMGHFCICCDVKILINDLFFMLEYASGSYENGVIQISPFTLEKLEIYVRKIDDTIYLIPYSKYCTKLFAQGALYMTLPQYNQIQDCASWFPPYEIIPIMTKLDCIRMFWVEAPETIRSSTEYKFDKKGYLNTDAPEGEEILSILQAMLKNDNSLHDLVALERISTESEISIILDTPDYFEWKALCRINNNYHLRLEPGYQVKVKK